MFIRIVKSRKNFSYFLKLYRSKIRSCNQFIEQFNKISEDFNTTYSAELVKA